MADAILVPCSHCGETRPKTRSGYCSDECRYWAKVDKSGGPDACWPWVSSKDGNGYGMFTHGGRSHRAHRWGYERTREAIPAGLLACHKCDNPCCCNPSHVFLGTAGDNNKDRARKGRTSYANAVEVMRLKKIGKRPPESTLEAARLANTGKKRPADLVAKIAAILKAKQMKRSDETKAKLRAAWVRRKEKMAAGRM